MRILSALLLFALGTIRSLAAHGGSIEVSSAIRDLVPASQLPALAKTYPIDKAIRWKLHIPDQTSAPGVLVFIGARDSGDPPPAWIRILDERNLVWIAACDFGNREPTAQRMLAALMGLAFVQREYSINQQRVYVAGMSGGGRVASKVITKFPRLFTGAIYIAGADYWEKSETSLLSDISGNSYVFITGSNDFNRREITTIFEKYQSAGVTQSYLMDLPHFGHQLPNGEQLRNALVFLDRK